MLSKDIESAAFKFASGECCGSQNESYAHTVNAFLAGYTARDEEDGWVNCKERLPEKTARYLILDDDGDVFIDFFDIDTKLFGIGIVEYENTDVTHWQPLPSKPVEK